MRHGWFPYVIELKIVVSNLHGQGLEVDVP